MCKLLSGRDQVSLAVCSSKWDPHPSFDASVKICRACFRGCNGWPSSTLLSSSHHLRWGWRDLGTGITFSSDSGQVNSGASLLVESGEGVGNLEVIHSPAEEVNIVLKVSQTELLRVLGHFSSLEIWSSRSSPEGEGVTFLGDFFRTWASP